MTQRSFKIRKVDIPHFNNKFETVECRKIVQSEDVFVPPNCEFVAPAKIESHMLLCFNIVEQLYREIYGENCA